jgi:hypothetical protein
MSSELPGPVSVRGGVPSGAAESATAAVFRAAGLAEVDAACAPAEAAIPHVSGAPLETRARCREAVADGIAELGAPPIERAMDETGQPRARVEGERARAVGQPRLFADPVRSACRSGRVLAKGWPTGAEVAPAMVQGGPFPATSDGRSSAVGPPAIERFLRPVRPQDLPDAPPPLRPDNPRHRARRIDGARAPQPGR